MRRATQLLQPAARRARECATATKATNAVAIATKTCAALREAQNVGISRYFSTPAIRRSAARRLSAGAIFGRFGRRTRSDWPAAASDQRSVSNTSAG